jgi:hypothetical protein
MAASTLLVRAELHIPEREDADAHAGLSLVNSSNPRVTDIPQMATSAKQTLGDRLDTFLLGNVSCPLRTPLLRHAVD